MTELNLAQLKIGERAVIASLDKLPPPSRQKLLDMGLTRGEEVVMIHKAPLGDPLWLSVKGYELAFRKEMAMNITVTPVAARAATAEKPSKGGAQG